MEILDENIDGKKPRKINWIAFIFTMIFLTLVFLGWMFSFFFNQDILYPFHILSIGKMDFSIFMISIISIVVFFEIICSAILVGKLFKINNSLFIQIFFFLILFFLFLFFIVMMWGKLSPNLSEGTLIDKEFYGELLKFKTFPSLTKFLFIQSIIFLGVIKYKGKKKLN